MSPMADRLEEHLAALRDDPVISGNPVQALVEVVAFVLLAGAEDPEFEWNVEDVVARFEGELRNEVAAQLKEIIGK